MRRTILGIVAATTLAGPAEAQKQPPLFNALIACRAIADAAERLSCFDKSTAALDTAAKNGDVLVADRAQVREAKRQVFGFGGVRIPFLSGNGNDTPTQIDATIRTTRDTGHGKWEFVLDNGMTWRQTDDEEIYPKAGDKVLVRTAAMGSYMLRLRSKAVRVIRTR